MNFECEFSQRSWQLARFFEARTQDLIMSRVPSIVAIDHTIFDKCLREPDKKNVKGFYINAAGAKDTEWIRPIYWARFSQVSVEAAVTFPSMFIHVFMHAQ